MLEFDLIFNEEPIKFKTAAGEREAVLREMSGKDRETYFDLVRKSVKTTKDKEGNEVTEILNAHGLSAALLKFCLWWKKGDQVIQAKESEILELPSRVIESLNEVASKMNGLDKESKEEIVKN
jgi:hypothetical protein